MTNLSPVDCFRGWFAKREDLVFAAGRTDETPCGAKVRQYMAMIEASPPDTALGVGCSRFSAMQVYVTAMASHYKRPAYVVVPAARERSPATAWCAAHGANVIEVRPGYPIIYRQRLRELGKEIPFVRWNAKAAAQDTADQVANLPNEVRRVLVPTGSGLTAAGVLAGLIQQKRHRDVTVVCVSVSIMVRDVGKIAAVFMKNFTGLGNGMAGTQVEVINHPAPYQRGSFGAWLPDGTLLDPFYAAKCLPYLRAGDCLWVVGRRPMALCRRSA